MELSETGLLTPTAKDLCDATVSQAALCPKPQWGHRRERVTLTHTEIPLHRLRGLVAKGNRPRSAALPHDDDDAKFAINVGDREGSHLFKTNSTIDHHAQEGLVAPVSKGSPVTCCQEL